MYQSSLVALSVQSTVIVVVVLVAWIIVGIAGAFHQFCNVTWLLNALSHSDHTIDQVVATGITLNEIYLFKSAEVNV